MTRRPVAADPARGVSPPCGADAHIRRWYPPSGVNGWRGYASGKGCINEIQLRSAIAHQDRWNTRIGEALVALGYLSERTMLSALAKQLGAQRRAIAEFITSLAERRSP